MERKPTMRKTADRPLIGIPIGDPAGIGPEIAVKALRLPALYETTRPLLVGEAEAVRKALEWCRIEGRVNTVASPREGVFEPTVVNLIDLKNLDRGSLAMGKVQATCGRAAFEYIERAATLALKGELDAVATAPINKESLKAAGVSYIGHTEILAGLTGVVDPLTMFEVGALRVFFLSRHLSLRDAILLVKKERLLACIERCCEALRRLGLAPGGKGGPGDGERKRPGASSRASVVAVSGLNPHCGERGLFGDEEVKEIAPAVEEARRRGFPVEGPIGADSVFHLALQGRYGAVISLYHDQGHIATKTYDFDRTISITLGLPFLRTSVDHGTAFDIAGTGSANELGMVQAVLSAARYARSYRESARATRREN
jgi:4-hydroxythreonine-4-phosphate dehydrogenase